MNNEQLLQNLAFNQLSLGGSTLYESHQADTRVTFTPSSVPLAFNKFMPMGIRVIVDLPYTQDPGTPLFAIRVTPTWMTPTEIALLSDDTTAKDFAKYMTNMPVFVPFTGGHTTYIYPEAETDAPVRVSYYGDPPPICRITRMHRFNKGSLKYQIVTTPGTVTHGYLQYSVQRGINWPQKVAQVSTKMPINTYAPDFSATYDNFANTKLSAEGFIELDVPRVMSSDLKDSSMDLFPFFGYAEPLGYDYIFVFAKGTMASLEKTQCVFEINIAGGDDFDVYTPLPVSTDMMNFWNSTDIFRNGNKYTEQLYQNPGLTYPSALKKYQSLFDSNGGLKPFATFTPGSNQRKWAAEDDSKSPALTTSTKKGEKKKKKEGE